MDAIGTPATNQYANEADGQADFFREYGLDPSAVLRLNTDGVHNGNLLEFKLRIRDVNQVLFQAVKYLSKFRLHGHDVPANILLVDLNAATVYHFNAVDYFAEIHETYATAASRDNKGFRARSSPTIIEDCFGVGAQQVIDLLRQTAVMPVRINEDCVVAWAERFYAENKGSTKFDFLNNDPSKGPLGELKAPKRFKGKILPYSGEHYEEFSHILDRLNDKLKKIELGAFYTPDPYVTKAHELLRQAIARVPEGNDYVIVDRCAGTGNLIRGLSDEELSHVIVNTYEAFEYLELNREFGQSVRAVIPPTYKAGDPSQGMLLNGDALSDRFVLGVEGPDGTRKPNTLQQYIDDPNCTIILFENPPYAEVASIEAQKNTGRDSFGWRNSYVQKQMKAEFAKQRGTKPVNELSNLFIWSAFRYYLRQPSDSYIVFSPAKYFKQHCLVQKRFVRGFLFNRKHFHAKTVAGVSVILWANEVERDRREFPLEAFDIDKAGALLPGADHKEWPNDGEPVVVRPTTHLLSTLYDAVPRPTDTPGGIVCELNGTETHRKHTGDPVWGPDIVGYMVAKGFSFENPDLNVSITRAARYDAHGTYLRRDNFLTQLPLFAACRFPATGRFWLRGVVSRCADNGDNFTADPDFLKSCLIYATLAYHNKCRSFTGSDGRFYRNELCLDPGSDRTGTFATRELAKHPLTDDEIALLDQWHTVLAAAKQARGYDPSLTYGLYQIDQDLNTRHRDMTAKGAVTVFDYPVLNGAISTLKTMTAAYHAAVVTPKLWEFGLIK